MPGMAKVRGFESNEDLFSNRKHSVSNIIIGILFV